MTILPNHVNWEATIHSIHRAARLIAAVRRRVTPPLPHHLHWSLMVVPRGLSTGVLPNGGEVTLDFIAQGVEVRRARQGGREPIFLSLAGHTQSSLLEALLGAMAAHEMADTLTPGKNQSYSQMFLAEPPIDPNILTGDAPFSVDAQLAIDYAHVLYSVFTAMARFRARIDGYLTPLVVWEHHFDLSFTHYIDPAQASDDAPQFVYGFAPFSDGIDRPYLYAYAYPMRADVTPTLDAPARWHTAGWAGAFLSYDAIEDSADLAQTVESALEQFQRAIASTLDSGNTEPGA